MWVQRIFETIKDVIPRRTPMSREIKFLWQILPVSLLFILYTNHLYMMDQHNPFILTLYDLRIAQMEEPQIKQELTAPVAEIIAVPMANSEL